MPDSSKLNLRRNLDHLRRLCWQQQRERTEHNSYAHGVTNGLILALGVMSGQRFMMKDGPLRVSIFRECFLSFLWGMVVTILVVGIFLNALY